MQDPRDKEEARKILGEHYDNAMLKIGDIELQLGIFKKDNGKFQARWGGGMDAMNAIAGEECGSAIMAINSLRGKL